MNNISNISNPERKGNSVEGILRNIIFHKDGFLIGTLDGNITIKGEIITPQIGMKYVFSGNWMNHPSFGNQFSFKDYDIKRPTNNEAIESYLIDSAKWIGPVVANQIVRTYGKKTLEICKDDPERVAQQINGITIGRAKQISTMLKAGEEGEKLAIALKEIFNGIPISKRVIGKIIVEYGKDAPERIKENPFSLIGHIDGIGFLTADRIARKVGYELDGPPRIKAGIIHTLKDLAQSRGHTYYPEEYLLGKVNDLLPEPAITNNLIKEQIASLEEKELVVIKNNNVYLKFYYDAEILIAQKLKDISSQELAPGVPDINGLKDDQIEAVYNAVYKNVFILTGAPGTGKTYTILRIINSFSGLIIKLAAPSGKAARRITEQTGNEAFTIHRLLEPKRSEGGNGFEFTRNSENPINADLIILDEVSMIDTILMRDFLDAVKPKTRLIFIGDRYQLPPVGPGNILKDLINSKAIPFTELTEIKRQDPGLIIQNCHKIKNGNDIKVDNANSKDFFFINKHRDKDIQETILDLACDRLPKAYKVNPFRDIQIITPLREKTILGCKTLNKLFQERLNKNPVIEKSKFKIGDKVIQMKNDYNLKIMNGDIGYVETINMEDKFIVVNFENPEREINIPLYENKLELAYALTCHKYQGSESRIVIIPIHKCFGVLVTQRSWIYTGISRASEICVLVGQRGEVINIIKRNKQQKRLTGLMEALRES